jgi:adenosine deaminase/adenosine deaminase CECR1
LFSAIKYAIPEDSVKKAVENYNNRLEAARGGIDDENFTMRFQTYTTRNSDPAGTFMSIYAAFRACTSNTAIVGVNFVGPENGIVAMSDYWLHMQMFHYFKSLPEFKNVHLALHAGELAMGLVKPEDMGYHIHDALVVAGAERIGHGVDLPYENQAVEILKHMEKNKTAIEINLTSNEFILGVCGDRHPIHLYYDARVPVIISTDDAGVSRNNLSSQYVLLAERYHFTYAQIKELVFNSITYSFLPEDLKKSKKALLETKFKDFEKSIASLNLRK